MPDLEQPLEESIPARELMAATCQAQSLAAAQILLAADVPVLLRGDPGTGKTETVERVAAAPAGDGAIDPDGVCGVECADRYAGEPLSTWLLVELAPSSQGSEPAHYPERFNPLMSTGMSGSRCERCSTSSETFTAAGASRRVGQPRSGPAGSA